MMGGTQPARSLAKCASPTPCCHGQRVDHADFIVSAQRVGWLVSASRFFACDRTGVLFCNASGQYHAAGSGSFRWRVSSALEYPHRTGDGAWFCGAHSSRPLFLWSTPIVVGHFIAVVWHLLLVLKVQSGFSRFAATVLILVNLIPTAGVVALAKGFLKLAGSMITVPQRYR